MGGDLWVFYGLPPGPAALPGESVGRKGMGYPTGDFPPPKPSPWGEGAPVRTLGRMRGRFGTQPFLVEKRRSPDCRLNEVFLLPRWASRSPPHPSPSVTASPQGEAFVGATLPPRNSFSPNPHPAKCESKSGHVHGPRNSPTLIPLRYPTPKQNERAASGLKNGGAGGHPPRLFASGLSLEKAWIPRPGPGGKPRGRCQPAPVPAGPAADDGGPPGRCTPWHRKSSTTRRVRSTLPRPRPGPGGNPPRRS